MNALIRKEIRLLMWPWIGALILAVAPGWLYGNHALQMWGSIASANDAILQLSLYAFALGCVVLSITTFGQEFAHRTFTLSLSQPIDRKKLWRTKTLILGAAVALIAVAVIVSMRQLIATYWQTPPGYDPYRHFSDMHNVFNDRARAFPASAFAAVLLAAIAYSGALWTTLAFRNFFTALSLTILVPSVLILFFSTWIFGAHSDHAVTISTIVVGSYSLAGYIFARWLFLRAEDVTWTGENISISAGNTKRFAIFTSFERTKPLFALFRKELQLQQVTFIVAGLLLVVHVASLGLRPLISPNYSGGVLLTLVTFVFIVWLALPVLIGSAAIADERRLGTMEMLLTQPVARWVQLSVKFTITLLLSFFFGCVVPFAIEKLAGASGPKNFVLQAEFQPLAFLSLYLAAVAFFSSTMARSSLDAFCLSIVSIAPLGMVVGFFASENPSVGNVPAYGLLTPYICAVIFVPTIIWCIWRNYRRIQVRWTTVAGTWLILAASFLSAWGACSFVCNRGWEVFMSLEPRHGAPVMRIDDHAKVLNVAHGAMALLADGRVWTTDYDYDVVYETRHKEHVVGAKLKNPHFLPDTWLDIAARPDACAIKADHTLWNLRPANRETNSNGHLIWKFGAPYQIGTDSDWASITAGGGFALGIKQDGSLWGWGSATSGALGPTTNKEFLTPRNVWPGTHWSRVFASGAFCFGIQTDGTAWQWGDDSISYSGLPAAHSESHRSEFKGGDWTSFSTAFHPVEFAVRGDHTLWTAISKRWLGHLSGIWRTFGGKVDVSAGLHQFGNDRDWKEITSTFPLCALKTNGTWFVGNGSSIDRQSSAPLQISRYSDWIAIDSGNATPIGLAADGTISAWMRIDPYPYYTSLTRRPTWSTNILAMH